MFLLSPGLWQRKNVRWLPLLVLLFALNIAVIWLWVGFLTLKFQRYLMYLGYLPLDSRATCLLPEVHNGLVESLTFPSLDGTLLHAHFYKAPHPADRGGTATQSPTVLFFHGTSGNIGHRVEYAQTLATLANVNLLLVNCRGYGLSEGLAHRAGIQLDSVAALRLLLEDPRLAPLVDASQIFVLGQSMGGAIAIDLASRHPELVAGLIVENTFTRFIDLVPEILPPFSPLRHYLTEDWNSLEALKHINRLHGETLLTAETASPRLFSALFIRGERDELVNPEHLQQLYEVAALHEQPGRVVRLVSYPNGSHVHTFKEPFYFDIVAAFINEVSALQ
jgi:pimeloyl-ACP methyl ester carboxylesterase